MADSTKVRSRAGMHQGIRNLMAWVVGTIVGSIAASLEVLTLWGYFYARHAQTGSLWWRMLAALGVVTLLVHLHFAVVFLKRGIDEGMRATWRRALVVLTCIAVWVFGMALRTYCHL